MTPAEVYELEPAVYHAFIRHMDKEHRASQRRKKG